jgi:Lauroyl/myristoyl acyltransferase
VVKRQGPIRNGFEYLGLLAGYVLLGLLPLCISRGIARIIADIWRAVDKRHRNRVIDQSLASLGISRDAAVRLARDNYRHYVYTVMEVIRLSRVPTERSFDYVHMDGADKRIREVLAEGKGAVFVTGHLGNWEWGCRFLGLIGGCDGVIARLLDNPRIDTFINNIRYTSGLEVWYKTGAIRKAMACLKRNRGFAAVLDQDGGWKGVMAPFLGKPASTMSMPVELAMRTGTPIIVMALLRDDQPMRFKAVYKRLHRPRPDAKHDEETLRLVTEINKDLSEIIMEFPEQWIWILNRWKTVKTQAQEQAEKAAAQVGG